MNHASHGTASRSTGIRRAPGQDRSNAPDSGQPEHSRARMPPQPRSIPADRPDHEGVPSLVHDALAQPGTPLDPRLQAFASARLGRDLGNVRIHSDPHAASSARSVDALAYNAGRHIVFDEGRFSPRTPVGLGLLFHELAHVAQQDPGSTRDLGGLRVGRTDDPSERAADLAARAALDPRGGALPVGPALRTSDGPVLRRAVSTWGGDWDTTRYADLATHDGVDIELHFKPGDVVDATEIGIVQKVTSRQGGAVVAVTPTVAARSVAAGANEGAHIDRVSTATNPLYPASDTAPAAHLWDSPTVADWGQHGFRHTDAKGKESKGDAILRDTPQLGGAGANSSQIFEDTALAVTGVQTGATYGSVQWGWRIDAGGAFHRLPLTKVSDDVPSASFKQAENLWNRNQNSAGVDLLRFHTATQQFVQADGTSLVRDPADAAGTELDKLSQNARVEVINKGVWEKFNKDPAVKWWKVTVTDGPATGKTGWILSSQLAATQVAAAVPVAP